jgi:hypothetical protein
MQMNIADWIVALVVVINIAILLGFAVARKGTAEGEVDHDVR